MTSRYEWALENQCEEPAPKWTDAWDEECGGEKCLREKGHTGEHMASDGANGWHYWGEACKVCGASPHKQGCPETWPDWLKEHYASLDNWRRITQHYALSQRVLAVATTRIEGAWSAYIDAVPGMNHAEEEAEVLAHGNKLPEQVARVLFPLFKELNYDQ